MPEDGVFIGLGANVGEPAPRILRAMADLGDLPATRVLARSSLYQTAPIGYRDQPDFINAVVRLSTTLSATGLLAAMLDIERRHGRVRAEKNGPRTLDLDLLIYGDCVDARPEMTLPHPRMHERAFVLLPLNEIAPGWVIPGRGPVARLLAQVTAQGVKRIHAA